MKTLRQFKKECMQDPEFAKEYKEMEEEFEGIRATMGNSMVDNSDMVEEHGKVRSPIETEKAKD